MLFITFTEKKGDLIMNKESQKQKMIKKLEGAVSLLLSVLFTFTVTGVIQTVFFAVVYAAINWFIVATEVILNAVMVASIVMACKDIKKNGKKKIHSTTPNIERILIVFCVIYKIAGYSELGWGYFIPIILEAVLLISLNILGKIFFYKTNTNVWEVALEQLPSTPNNDVILRQYHMLKDEISMEMTVGSKEWRKNNKEIAKFFYQEATNTIY